MDWLSLSDVEARVNALESLMVEKGLAEHEAVDAVGASFENARFWVKIISGPWPRLVSIWGNDFMLVIVSPPTGIEKAPPSFK